MNSFLFFWTSVWGLGTF